MSPFKFIVVFSMFAMLVGCQEKVNYTYLMEHPAFLKDEVMRCESSGGKVSSDAPSCDLVMRAANDFTNLINEQQEDPEKFGQRILDAESTYVKAKINLKEEKKSLSLLKDKKGESAEQKIAQEKLEKAEKDYQEKRTDVKILLAVVSLNSPE